MAAARNVDGELFIETHDYRYGVLIRGFAQGKTLSDTAKDCGAGYSKIYQLRQKLAEDLIAFLGEEAVEDSAQIPRWRAHLIADHERAACQADRRRR